MLPYWLISDLRKYADGTNALSLIKSGRLVRLLSWYEHSRGKGESAWGVCTDGEARVVIEIRPEAAEEVEDELGLDCIASDETKDAIHEIKKYGVEIVHQDWSNVPQSVRGKRDMQRPFLHLVVEKLEQKMGACGSQGQAPHMWCDEDAAIKSWLDQQAPVLPQNNAPPGPIAPADTGVDQPPSDPSSNLTGTGSYVTPQWVMDTLPASRSLMFKMEAWTKTILIDETGLAYGSVGRDNAHVAAPAEASHGTVNKVADQSLSFVEQLGKQDTVDWADTSFVTVGQPDVEDAIDDHPRSPSQASDGHVENPLGPNDIPSEDRSSDEMELDPEPGFVQNDSESLNGLAGQSQTHPSTAKLQSSPLPPSSYEFGPSQVAALPDEDSSSEESGSEMHSGPQRRRSLSQDSDGIAWSNSSARSFGSEAEIENLTDGESTADESLGDERGPPEEVVPPKTLPSRVAKNSRDRPARATKPLVFVKNSDSPSQSQSTPARSQSCPTSSSGSNGANANKTEANKHALLRPWHSAAEPPSSISAPRISVKRKRNEEEPVVFVRNSDSSQSSQEQPAKKRSGDVALSSVSARDNVKVGANKDTKKDQGLGVRSFPQKSSGGLQRRSPSVNQETSASYRIAQNNRGNFHLPLIPQTNTSGREAAAAQLDHTISPNKRRKVNVSTGKNATALPNMDASRQRHPTNSKNLPLSKTSSRGSLDPQKLLSPPATVKSSSPVPPSPIARVPASPHGFAPKRAHPISKSTSRRDRSKLPVEANAPSEDELDADMPQHGKQLANKAPEPSTEAPKDPNYGKGIYQLMRGPVPEEKLASSSHSLVSRRPRKDFLANWSNRILDEFGIERRALIGKADIDRIMRHTQSDSRRT